MTEQAPTVDPCDVAYLGIGAASAWTRRRGALAAMCYGQAESVGVAAQYGPLLAGLWREVKDEWPGVWAYDLCEPLGFWIVADTAANSREPDAAAVEAEARRQIAHVLAHA